MGRWRAIVIAILSYVAGGIVAALAVMAHEKVQRAAVKPRHEIEEEFEVGSGIARELRGVRPEAEIHAWDGRYWGCSMADWEAIIADVLRDVPVYKAERFDCDNFAILFSALVAQRYQLNTCAIAIGTSPGGYHAWNLIRAEDGWHILEPQNGRVDPAGYWCDFILCA